MALKQLTKITKDHLKQMAHASGVSPQWQGSTEKLDKFLACVVDTINIELNKVVNQMEQATPVAEQRKTHIGLGDIISVAKMEGLDVCIMGHQKTFECFAEKIVEMIDDELRAALDNQRARFRGELESMEFWALIKIQGKEVALLGSYAKKPKWMTLANVAELADKLNVNKLRRLAEENLCKLDDWTSYKMIRLERPEVDLGVC
ncbi:hypothetical protein SHab15497_00062 [Acinetobacter phage SH-Ab 15497]|nr:hypothetical protein SHab15497_00062 [Acinetobacter phage SH-Ab 15497]